MIQPTLLLASSANNMTGTAVLHSKPLDMTTWTRAALWANWTGTPTGTIIVEGSMDYGLNGANATWVSLGVTGITSPAGSSGGNSLIDMIQTGMPYIRLTYTNASGTGTLQVYGSAKGY